MILRCKAVGYFMFVLPFTIFLRGIFYLPKFNHTYSSPVNSVQFLISVIQSHVLTFFRLDGRTSPMPGTDILDHHDHLVHHDHLLHPDHQDHLVHPDHQDHLVHPDPQEPIVLDIANVDLIMYVKQSVCPVVVGVYCWGQTGVCTSASVLHIFFLYLQRFLIVFSCSRNGYYGHPGGHVDPGGQWHEPVSGAGDVAHPREGSPSQMGHHYQPVGAQQGMYPCKMQGGPPR